MQVFAAYQVQWAVKRPPWLPLDRRASAYKRPAAGQQWVLFSGHARAHTRLNDSIHISKLDKDAHRSDLSKVWPTGFERARPPLVMSEL